MIAKFNVRLRGKKRQGFRNCVARMNGPGRGGQAAHVSYTEGQGWITSTFLITITGGEVEIWSVMETFRNTFPGRRFQRVI